jgi:outer membrane scaffolding protein for murein synthesis (MipA/OmpV family)
VRYAIPEAALAAALAIAPCAANADLLPLWEAGIGVAPIDFPDYPGSNQRSFYALPLPYFVYRGEQLRVGREGIRELFFQSDRVELDLSASASVPVKSENNEARAGMPDLDPTFQLGPALDIKLHQDDQHKLKLRLPARFAFATDFTYVKGTGFVFEPQIVLDTTNLRSAPEWRFGIAVGPLFADRRYNSYYYTVDPQFATPQRPAYQAPAGFAGTQVLLSTSRRYGDWWLGAFLRYQSLDGAVFRDSPLVKQRYAFAGGFGVAWVFARSGKLVEADE